MAFSVNVSSKYPGIFSRLMGKNGDASYATVGLCLDMGRFFLSKEENDVSFLLDEESFLNLVLLAKGYDSKSLYFHDKSILNRPLVLKKTVYKQFTGAPFGSEELYLAASYLTPAKKEDTLQTSST